MTPESLSPGADQKLIGSIMVFEAANINEVREIIESDIYYKSSVVSLRHAIKPGQVFTSF